MTPPIALTEPDNDDLAVDRFAAAMKAKLAKKREQGRGGWNDPDQCSLVFLAKLLVEHVVKGDPLDVGNFAMMLWNRGCEVELLREARLWLDAPRAGAASPPTDEVLTARATIAAQGERVAELEQENWMLAKKFHEAEATIIGMAKMKFVGDIATTEENRQKIAVPPAQPSRGKCETCNGTKMIIPTVPTTAGSYAQPCPDCAQPERREVGPVIDGLRGLMKPDHLGHKLQLSTVDTNVVEAAIALLCAPALSEAEPKKHRCVECGAMRDD